MPEQAPKGVCGCGHPYSEHYHDIRYSQAGELLSEKDGCIVSDCDCSGYYEASDA